MRTVEQLFVVYVDFESCLATIDVKRGKGTTQYQEHKPSGYVYQLVSRVDPKDNKFVHYTAQSDGEDAADHFFKSLEETARELYSKYGESKPMIITDQQQHEFDLAERCVGFVVGMPGMRGNGKRCETTVTTQVSTVERHTASVTLRWYERNSLLYFSQLYEL